MGWIDEQLQESSRGDNLSRDNLQLNLFTDNKSEDEQKQIIEKTEVLENNTPEISKINEKQEETNLNKIDFHITDNDLGIGTPKEKVQNNINAIKTLKQIESENRLATKDEQEILSKYVGWGGLPDVFDESKTEWTNEYNEIKDLLTKEEYDKAKESTLTAFYTPPIVIKSIYDALQNMGLEQANILEPSCRSWKFLWNAT